MTSDCITKLYIWHFCILICKCEFQLLDFIQINILQNSRILPHALSSQSSYGSALACASACAQGEQCVSFFYNPHTDVCTTHFQRFWGPDRGVEEAGCLYYTRPVKKRLDCLDILKGNPNATDGVYTVQPPDTGGTLRVYCDMSTKGGGWTVFQRRQGGAVSFTRNWIEYKNGFGNLSRDFWLGNDALHRLTTHGKVRLRIDMLDEHDTPGRNGYFPFRVGDERSNYRLHVSYHGGNKRDALLYHDGMMFSTVDRKNDRALGNSCAEKYQAGWWYKNCMESNLNGIYNEKVKQIYWWAWTHRSLKEVEMKLRPRL